VIENFGCHIWIQQRHVYIDHPSFSQGGEKIFFFADQCNRRLLSIKCACAHVCETEMDRHGVEHIAEVAEGK
jgi:hypothetical protein